MILKSCLFTAKAQARLRAGAKGAKFRKKIVTTQVGGFLISHCFTKITVHGEPFDQAQGRLFEPQGSSVGVGAQAQEKVLPVYCRVRYDEILAVGEAVNPLAHRSLPQSALRIRHHVEEGLLTGPFGMDL